MMEKCFSPRVDVDARSMEFELGTVTARGRSEADFRK